jgi:hypothetical protein
VRRWVPPLLALIALGLVPWAIWLTTVLPSHETAPRWDLAWGGFDLLLAAAVLATAVAAWRASPRRRMVRSVHVRRARPNVAIVLAVVAELPLATLCFWIVLDSETCTRRLARWRNASSNGSRTVATSPGDGRATPTRSSSPR